MTGLDISVSWQLAGGKTCCCGDPDCEENIPDRWGWVARWTGSYGGSGHETSASATGDTPEEARAGVEPIARALSEGRRPIMAEIFGKEEEDAGD